MSANGNGANLGFEQHLWRAADALRSNMDAAEYKHVVLGLIFLKYISDAFAEQYARLEADRAQGADPEDPDEYRAVNIFWVPKEARWSQLKENAKQPSIGKIVDDAMLAIERDNPSLKGVLPKDYAHPRLDKQRLGQLIDLISNIGLGDKENRSKDILGRVYEYFLSQFASAEGKKGGQFYTPRSVVQVLVEMLAPYHGRVYDPACGSGGMFVQSEKFVEAHGGKIGDISIYGQESNHTTWRLAKMNLAIRGIDANLGKENADSFHRDLHPDLRADYVLANPPFNDSDWRGELLKDDKRWQFGTPPASNANFAWVQHFIYHLAPTGLAGFVLANGSMSSNQSGEGEIRKNIIEADLVDCMVALPGHLFYSTYNQVCLWFIAREKKGEFRDRRRQVLFIDARNLGTMVDRTHRELSNGDIQRITECYHNWRNDRGTSTYSDVPGFCRSVGLEHIRKLDYILTPGRYVGSEVSVDDDEPVEERMIRLTSEFAQQVADLRKQDDSIIANLVSLGYCQNTGLGVEIGSLDKPLGIRRIQLNRRTNEALSEMISVLFKSWFIDFEPAHTKVRGGECSLPREVADLFPDTFEESALGEIPLGWRIGVYEEVLSPSNARIGDEDVLEYSATVTGLMLREQRFNKQLAKSRKKNKKITYGDVVFGLSRRVINFGLMKDTVGSVSPVYEVFKVDADVYIPELLEMYIRHNMSNHMDILKPGAREGQPIDRDYLLSKELLIPDMKVQRSFCRIFSGG